MSISCYLLLSIFNERVIRFFYIPLILFSSIVFGQSDSLINYAKQVDGKERVEALHNVVIDLWLNYPNRAMGYGEEALQLAKELNDSTLISKSLRLIAGVYYYKGDFNLSLEYNEKALAIAHALNLSLIHI